MKVPYEFLARWNAQGVLTGAHVIFQNVFTEGGVTHVGGMDPAMPVSVGAKQGYPLADVLKSLHVSALSKCDALEAEKATMREEHAAELERARERHETEVKELNEAVSREAAQVAELRQSVAVKDGQIEVLMKSSGKQP